MGCCGSSNKSPVNFYNGCDLCNTKNGGPLLKFQRTVKKQDNFVVTFVLVCKNCYVGGKVIDDKIKLVSSFSAR